MYLSELIFGFITFCCGCITVYLTAYSKEKGKNKALKEDLIETENEKKRIQAKFDTELESIKKQHALDIKKREFRYIDKREQFTKYFGLLESFHTKSNTLISDRFQSVMPDFFAAFASGDKDRISSAIKFFAETNNEIFRGLYEDLNKLKAETHGLRLVSSDELDSLLNELDAVMTNSINCTSEMLQFMSKPEFWQDQKLLTPYQENVERSAREVELVHSRVKKQMKAELDEI
ncbi:hypothetical protein FORC18_1113 [Vibrio parahaemolyticus]|uniref:hypothetical protein n=1 Tax=Vibrio parahaemolyticus TaxID=670 RepID=UPI00069D6460|nr:hypothetical protein [Vibrio parahaemolyticus]EGQ9971504.1 hypothetical protein [Vibrio vulnificus]AKU54670.1 hypothetical protein FORC8_1110 [Vibrio parahaemolyticus]APE83726.1 hypothetical protein FORC18_1113 [Vibrio parahaemolyticus]HDY7433935.1 hypothetical protein [Vibrio vulnificus]HDY8091029.1 hypothetical protein [Vibrio vulnificus]